MTFRKSLARYYHQWFRDCADSYIYCLNNNRPLAAMRYLEDFRKYAWIIANNWEVIDFFSIDDNAFIKDSALPIQFRGYE